MSYLLDTNVVIALLRRDERVLSELHVRAPSEIAVSSIVMYELYFGAFKGARTAANLMRFDALRFELLPFDRADARAAGEIRARLAVAGTPIGPYDLLIAGQALARGRTLVTRNVREFGRVSGLQVEDWEGLIS